MNDRCAYLQQRDRAARRAFTTHLGVRALTMDLWVAVMTGLLAVRVRDAAVAAEWILPVGIAVAGYAYLRVATATRAAAGCALRHGSDAPRPDPAATRDLPDWMLEPADAANVAQLARMLAQPAAATRDDAATTSTMLTAFRAAQVGAAALALLTAVTPEPLHAAASSVTAGLVVAAVILGVPLTIQARWAWQDRRIDALRYATARLRLADGHLPCGDLRPIDPVRRTPDGYEIDPRRLPHLRRDTWLEPVPVTDSFTVTLIAGGAVLLLMPGAGT